MSILKSIAAEKGIFIKDLVPKILEEYVKNERKKMNNNRD